MKLKTPVLAYLLGVITSTLAITVGSALGAARHTTFDTLDVHRINILEPDGTLRMVLSDKAEFPGIVFRGKEYLHASRTDAAGAIFLNDEGTENGGLIFGGTKTGGQVRNFGHLSFDQYEQDQVLSLEQGETNGSRSAGLSIIDRPDTPLDIVAWSHVQSMPDGPAKTAEIERLTAAGGAPRQRLFLGKTAKKDAEIDLTDESGRQRLKLIVTANGEPSIQFLDANGKVTRTLGAGSAN